MELLNSQFIILHSELRTTNEYGDDARSWIATEVGEAITVARRVGAKRLAVLGGADPQRPLALQHGMTLRDYFAGIAMQARVAAAAVAAAGATMARIAGVESICPKNMTVFFNTSVDFNVS